MSLKELQGSEQYSIMLVDRSFKGSEQKAWDIDPNSGDVTVGVGNLVVSKGHFKASFKDGLVGAAAGTQAAGTPIPADLNRFSTVALNSSALLPTAKAGFEITIMNAGANPILVFAANNGTDVINALANGTSFSVAAGKTATFYCAKTGQWHTILSA